MIKDNCNSDRCKLIRKKCIEFERHGFLQDEKEKPENPFNGYVIILVICLLVAAVVFLDGCCTDKAFKRKFLDRTESAIERDTILVPIFQKIDTVFRLSEAAFDTLQFSKKWINVRVIESTDSVCFKIESKLQKNTVIDTCFYKRKQKSDTVYMIKNNVKTRIINDAKNRTISLQQKQIKQDTVFRYINRYKYVPTKADCDESKFTFWQKTKQNVGEFSILFSIGFICGILAMLAFRLLVK